MMGYYVQTEAKAHGKAAEIVDRFGGMVVSMEEAAQAMEYPMMGVIVVVDNGPFEAAGFAFSMHEWEVFSGLTDERPKQFVVLDRKIAEEISGFNKREQ